MVIASKDDRNSVIFCSISQNNEYGYFQELHLKRSIFLVTFLVPTLIRHR